MVDYLGHGFTTTPNNTPTVITSSSLIYAQPEPYVVPSVFTGTFKITNFSNIIRGDGLYKIRASGTLPYSSEVMFLRTGNPAQRGNDGIVAIDFSKARTSSLSFANPGQEIQFDYSCDLYVTSTSQSWRNEATMSYYAFSGEYGYKIVNSGRSTSSTWLDDLNVYLTTTPSSSIISLMVSNNPQGLLTTLHCTVEYQSQ